MVRLNIDVPKEMYNIASQEDISEHPYDLCLHCPFIQESCDGPNILAMEYPRWVEWANARAKQLGLTRARIAELSNIPKGTVDSVMAGRGKDLRSATLRDITKVLIGGCWGQYPCHFAAMLMRGELADTTAEPSTADAKLVEENQQLRKRLDWFEEHQDEAKEEAQRKVDYLRERVDYLKGRLEKNDETIAHKERTISRMQMVFFVIVALLFALFAADLALPTMGWMRF